MEISKTLTTTPKEKPAAVTSSIKAKSNEPSWVVMPVWIARWLGA